MDSLDARLIDLLQHGIPVTGAPFAPAARALGIDEQAVVDRVGRLLDAGVLTRFGPMFNADRMGGAFTLAAMQVPAARFDEIAARVNAYPEVAHNYARDHVWNMWFVVASDDAGRIAAVLDDIRRTCDCPLIDLPKLDEYFVGLHLPAVAG